MALSNQYYNVDDKLVDQSIVRVLFTRRRATGCDERGNDDERNHKSE